MSGSILLLCKLTLERHFAGRKSLLYLIREHDEAQEQRGTGAAGCYRRPAKQKIVRRIDRKSMGLTDRCKLCPTHEGAGHNERKDTTGRRIL
jgi:hypothetical protein